MNNYKWIKTADTAKLIRAQLKKNFPNTKFWVRSHTYSGGSSIDIDWMNGPTERQVKDITYAFNGAGFDGMVDMKLSNTAWLLPDGSAAFARHEVDSQTEEKYTSPHPQAELVHFAADYIFTNRHYSPDTAKPIIKAICDEFGKPEPKYYEGHPFFGPKQNMEVLVLSWDCLSPEWGDLDHFINSEIRSRLDVDFDNSPTVITVDPERTEQESIRVSWDRDWTWINFPDKPSEAVRDLLKEHLHARYSSKRRAWYVMETIDENTIRIKLGIAHE